MTKLLFNPTSESYGQIAFRGKTLFLEHKSFNYVKKF